jgi:hypothetical protein
LNRNLGGITQINLAGIRPRHEATVALGDGKDYRDRMRKLVLPIAEEGAYLVVCRGDNLHASGLVLVTPLAIEVQADRVAGRVRATVKDREKYQPGVQVKVIGSGNQDFVSGQTDLRGVFVADGIRGFATVIAQAGRSRYAFYRAKESLSAPPREVAPRPLSAGAAGRRAWIGSGHNLAEEERIEEALDAPTALDFNEQPLSDVIDYLKEKHDIPIQLDVHALNDMGLNADTPVSKCVKGVSLRAALRLTLRDYGLTYLIKDGVLLITTPEKADEELITRTYPVADLVLPPGAPEGTAPDFDALIDLITSTIRPTSWEDVGGPGSVRPFGNKLSIVLSQTQEVHEEIADLLDQLRAAGQRPGSNGPHQPRANRSQPQSAGGTWGGGMWGAGTGNGDAGAPRNGAAKPAGAEKTDLLEGVQQTNRGFQGKQSEKLKKTYERGGGMGGMAGGAGFF